MTRTPGVPSFVLTAQCPDTTGVVAAVAGFLAQQNGLITELQHFDDEYSDVSFVRVVVAVSRSGHCLNSLLHRWSIGGLPIEIAAVVSNHEDLRSLVEWHGVPYHYLPVSDGHKRDQEARLETVVDGYEAELLVRAVKWHAELRVFRNGLRTVVLR